MFKFSKIKITNKGLYWGLIITFAILYLCVGFVSTLHSITFFHLANSIGLAVLLGLTYEVGQASVLFSILMTKGKEKFLPWALMFLLTALQVTANVYASFKFMLQGGNTDYIYWQKSILFGVQASSPEMYQVIISWIAGALLPVVALGMTALVAQNIKLATEEEKDELPEIIEKEAIDISQFKSPNIVSSEYVLFDNADQVERARDIDMDEDDFNKLNNKQSDSLKAEFEKYDNINKLANLVKKETVSSKVVVPQIEIPLFSKELISKELIEPGTTTLSSDLKVQPIDFNRTLSPSFLIEATIDNKNDSNSINENEERDYLDEEVDELTASPEFQKDFVKPEDKMEQVPVKEDTQEIAVVIDTKTEKIVKKRGRPPKQKETVVELKKEQEPLLNEDVKVPEEEKRHRFVNPLNKKGNKPELIKHIEQINAPSKGEELIQSLENDVKSLEDSIPIEQPIIVETPSPEPIKEFKDSIEIIDVKAVPVKKSKM